jgi:tetratricopeptide (TPR) repeat protein
MLEGDWQTAREFSDRALTVSELDPRNLGKRVLLEHEVGDWSQSDAFVKRQVEVKRLLAGQAGAGQGYPAIALPVAARISGDLGWLPEAQEAARTILSSENPTPLWFEAARIGLAMSAVLTGDDGEAREQYNPLLLHRGTLFHQINMSADRLLGLLSQTMGDLDQAAEHFEEGLAFCRKAGYRPELAWTCCDYADTLLQRNDPGDREKAMALLDESLAISSELGMRPLMERVLSRREILGA